MIDTDTKNLIKEVAFDVVALTTIWVY